MSAAGRIFPAVALGANGGNAPPGDTRGDGYARRPGGNVPRHGDTRPHHARTRDGESTCPGLVTARRCSGARGTAFHGSQRTHASHGSGDRRGKPVLAFWQRPAPHPSRAKMGRFWPRGEVRPRTALGGIRRATHSDQRRGVTLVTRVTPGIPGSTVRGHGGLPGCASAVVSGDRYSKTSRGLHSAGQRG
jgi:hypothetical protein